MRISSRVTPPYKHEYHMKGQLLEHSIKEKDGFLSGVFKAKVVMEGKEYLFHAMLQNLDQ